MKRTLVLTSALLLAGCSLDQLTRTQAGAQRVANATTQPQVALAAVATDVFVPGLGTAVVSLVAAAAGLVAAGASKMAKDKAEGKAHELSKANAVLNTVVGAANAATVELSKGTDVANPPLTK